MKLRLKKPILSPFIFMTGFLIYLLLGLWSLNDSFAALLYSDRDKFYVFVGMYAWQFLLWLFSVVFALFTSFRIERRSAAPSEEVAE